MKLVLIIKNFYKRYINSYYYLLQRFSKENGPKQKLLWGNYNFGFDSVIEEKDDDVRNSDILIIPSENSFTIT